MTFLRRRGVKWVNFYKAIKDIFVRRRSRIAKTMLTIHGKYLIFRLNFLKKELALICAEKRSPLSASEIG